MKRIRLSDEQFSKIISLRKSGVKWLGIQKETGVSRRIAQREYEEWERNQAQNELKDARKTVVAEAFRGHVDNMIKVAEELAYYLQLPSSSDMQTSADQFLGRLWSKDFTSQRSPESLEEQHFDPNRNLRRNILLLKSLQSHTQGVVRWNDLSEWKNHWNSYVTHSNELQELALKMTKNFLQQEKAPELVRRIKDDTQEEDPVLRMVKFMISQISNFIRNGELIPQKEPLTRAASEQGFFNINLVNSYNMVFRFRNKEMAEIVEGIYNKVVHNIAIEQKEGILKALKIDIEGMRTLKSKLEEELEPLKLQPHILRTRCDICPA